MEGVVIWWNDSKGYGFIKTDTKDNIFVHYSEIVVNPGEFKTLYDGQKVTFECYETSKGYSAKKVVKL